MSELEIDTRGKILEFLLKWYFKERFLNQDGLLSDCESLCLASVQAQLPFFEVQRVGENAISCQQHLEVPRFKVFRRRLSFNQRKSLDKARILHHLQLITDLYWILTLFHLISEKREMRRLQQAASSIWKCLVSRFSGDA